MLLVVQQRVSFRALALKGYKPPGCAPCRPCCGWLCSVVIDAAFPVIEFNVSQQLLLLHNAGVAFEKPP